MYSPQTSDYTRKADLDQSFRETLDSIRTSYRALSSQSLKIRVEKWCSKLVSTGSSSGNRVFAKHRNDYASLLLYMVQRKKFEEPFNSLPPEGPLPSFPNHKRIHINDSSSNREASFWNDLKSDLDRNHGSNTLPSSSIGMDVSATHTFASSGVKKTTRLSPRSLKNGPPSGSYNHTEKYGTNSVFVNNTMAAEDPRQVEEQVEIIESLRKEIDRLVVQNKQYEAKVEQLQLMVREEKIKHDLTVQRLQHDHRLELAKLEAGANRSSPTSAAYQYETQYRSIHGAPSLRPNQHGYDSDEQEEHGDLPEDNGSRKQNNTYPFINAKSTFSNQTNNENSIANENDNIDDDDNDYIKKYDDVQITDVSKVLAANNYHVNNTNGSTRNSVNVAKTREEIKRKNEDDEFLEYIEKFQAEIRRSVNMDDDE